MFELKNLEIAAFPTATRLPFRYGIAELTAMPHIFMRATVELQSARTRKVVQGVSADSLIPRWFEKDAAAPFQKDLDRLWTVVRRAGEAALGYGRLLNPFDLWFDLYEDQVAWGLENGYAPLLAHFGVTLVERCVVDAVCRAGGAPFASLLSEGGLGIDVSRIREAPSGESLASVLRGTPLRKVRARHTVGLSDPLERSDVTAPIADGLPECLEEDIDRYGLSYFKIKVAGDMPADLERLRRIHSILSNKVGADYRCTLDGNEQFSNAESFREFWDAARRSQPLSELFSHVLFVEQPFKRDIALSDSVGASLRAWPERPPMIIDESDGSLDSLPRAFECGFHGTSYKSCKGVFKGLINAARVADRRRSNPSGNFVLSAEDLVNIGPVALLQDLAVVAKLGISHVERNGHHYFHGLGMFPEGVQDAMLRDHPDLYRRMPDGVVELRVDDGAISTESINAAPFGAASIPEGAYVALSDWAVPRAPSS